MRREPRSSTHAIALALAGLALAGAASGCDSQPPQWKLVWQDEFDGPAGAPPDPNYWGYDVGGGGWGNNQLEFDTARPENVSQDGQGHLAITARKESYQGRQYTSGRILTRGRFEQALGRIEARIRLPWGQGIWPAFWMLGANYPEVGWPACGEIDIVELRGQEPGVANGSLHAPGYFGGSAITAPYVCGSLPTCSTPPCAPLCPFPEDFHVFAVEVEADRILFEVDGAIYQQVKRELLPTGTAWPFENPFYILLNVAVGGSYVGAPDVMTVFPQTMLVDYVRYYQLDP
jgi:beta-glucanase (GH16 family)